MHERREFTRIQVPVLIEFPHPQTMKTERSFTQDVSETGLRFPTAVRLGIGKSLPLSFSLPYQHSQFHATGEVIWIREIARHGGTQYDVGLRFQWIEDPDRQRLSQFLQTVLNAKV